MFATKLRLTAAAAALAFAGLAGSAEAAPIQGGFSIGAGVANTNLTTTNAIDFTTNAQVQNSSGVYSGVLSAGAIGSIVDILSLTPFSAITNFLNFGGGITVDLLSVTNVVRSTTPTGNTLMVSGIALFHLPGFDTTQGTILLSAQDAGGTGTQVSVSGSMGVVPEPASVALLGGALLGLGLVRRRRPSH